jgi:hypothetical protein
VVMVPPSTRLIGPAMGNLPYLRNIGSLSVPEQAQSISQEPPQPTAE